MHERALAGASALSLVGSWAVAVRRPVPEWELRLTEGVNGAPAALATALYPVMQLGTVGAPLLLAGGLLVVRRDRRTAIAALAVGLGAWFGAKGVKLLVERDRPLSYVPELLVREGDGRGLGFLSGHSAVAAATAVVVASLLPPRWRGVPAALAALVGIGRIVHGVHLPADVVGGWGFGTLLGLGGVRALQMQSARRR